MIVPFGPAAARYALRLPPSLDAVLTDGTDAAEALAEIVGCRRRGVPAYAAVFLADERAARARMYAPLLLRQITDPDERRAGFENLAAGVLEVDGTRLADVRLYEKPLLHTLREVLQTADAVLVRSAFELHALRRVFELPLQDAAIAPLADPSVPDVTPRAGASRIVVWGPELPADALAIHAYALAHAQEPPLIVCRGELAGVTAEFIAPDAGAAALREAALVVDASLDDPGTAIALAQRGFTVAAAATCGAADVIAGLVTYDAANFRTIIGAAARGRGRRKQFVSVPDIAPALDAVLARTIPVLPDPPPLVTVVVPTYNRPTSLGYCLDSLAHQTYSALEVLVVNDAGEDVAGVVARYPFARLIERPENGGTPAAINEGLASARGAFVCALADDDAFYPDHLARLVEAAEASGAGAVHANLMVRVVSSGDDGIERTIGHHISHYDALDTIEMYWHCGISQQAVLMRTALMLEGGGIDERWTILNDYDFIIRFGKRTDFVHVDRVTCEMLVDIAKPSLGRRDPGKVVDELRAMLATHLPPDRPLIAARQRETVALQQRNLAERSGFSYLPLRDSATED